MKAFMQGMKPEAVSVRNFEHMNHMPPRDRLAEKHCEIVKGMTNIWYEWVPESYDGSKSVPLVVQLHGGGNDGKRWADITVWHMLADVFGFIVIYPNSPEFEMWQCTERDVDYLFDLIEHVCKEYNIDRQRIFMQGMSNGDMMTLAFTMRHPEVLAAAGFTTGPSPAEAVDEERPLGALPIIQMRGEKDVNWHLTPDVEDVYAIRYEMNDFNREIWEAVNETTGIYPLLSIQGRNNYLCWQGNAAPIINWEVQNMGHREPPEAAQVYWDYLYSGCFRDENGCHVGVTNESLTGDDDLILLCMGTDKIYRKDRPVEMGSLTDSPARIISPENSGHFCPIRLEEMYETDTLYAPVEFFRAAYHAQVTIDNPGDCVSVKFLNGPSVEFYADSALIKVDGRYKALQKPCCLICGVFYVPVGEFCADIMGSFVSVADDMMCISSHYAVLGRYTARVIRKILKGSMRKRRS